jgi:hypothetical protein
MVLLENIIGVVVGPTRDVTTGEAVAVDLTVVGESDAAGLEYGQKVEVTKITSVVTRGSAGQLVTVGAQDVIV